MFSGTTFPQKQKMWRILFTSLFSSLWEPVKCPSERDNVSTPNLSSLFSSHFIFVRVLFGEVVKSPHWAFHPSFILSSKAEDGQKKRSVGDVRWRPIFPRFHLQKLNLRILTRLSASLSPDCSILLSLSPSVSLSWFVSLSLSLPASPLLSLSREISRAFALSKPPHLGDVTSQFAPALLFAGGVCIDFSVGGQSGANSWIKGKKTGFQMNVALIEIGTQIRYLWVFDARNHPSCRHICIWLFKWPMVPVL